MIKRFLLAAAACLLAAFSASAQLANVTVTPSTLNHKIPGNFGGLTLDFWDGQNWVANPLYPQLIKNLIFKRQTFNINIEGDDPSVPSTPNATTIGTYNTLFSTLAASNMPLQFTLPVPMCASANPATYAEPFASAYLANAGPGWIGITVGNEPDGNISVCPGGGGSYAGGYSGFLTNYNAFVTGMNAVSGGSGIRFVGPSFGGQQTWVYTSPDLNSFVNGQGTKLVYASQHWYTQNGCSGSPSLAAELSKASATPQDFTLTGGIWNYVANAHAAGVPLRISEMNDVDCSGVSGISDTFANALWVMDALSNLAAVGTDGANIFSDFEDFYDFFEFPSLSACTINVTSGCTVRPNYYGMMVFQELVQNSSNFVPCGVSSGAANVVCWATKDADQNVRVLILNKDQSASGTVNITVPGMGLGYLKLLTASGGVTAKTGITYAGQTFDGSTTGAITGTFTQTVLTPASNVYSFSLTVTQAALLTIPPVTGLTNSGPPGWTQILYTELQGSGNANSCPLPFPPGSTADNSCVSLITTWDSGVADTSRNRLLLWGGGHADYPGNEIYSVDLTQVGLCTNALPCLKRLNMWSTPNTVYAWAAVACVSGQAGCITSSPQATSPSCTASQTPFLYASPPTITCTNPNSGTTIMCYTFNSSTVPVTNGLGTACTTGTVYTGSITACPGSNPCLNVVAGVAGEADSLEDINASEVTTQEILPTGGPGSFVQPFTPGTSPNSRHPYDGMVYVPAHDLMFINGGALDATGFASNGVWTLPLSTVPQSCAVVGTSTSQVGCTTTAWTQQPNYPQTTGLGPGWMSIYDPVHDVVWTNSQSRLAYFSFATNTWTTALNNNVINWNVFQTSVYDDYDQYMITFGPDLTNTGKQVTYTPISTLTPSAVFYPGLDASCAAANVSYPGLAWDPVDRKVVVYPGTGNIIWLLDPHTWKCTTETYGTTQLRDYPQNTGQGACGGTGTPANPGSNGYPVCTFKRFAYFPQLDIFLLENDYGNNAWYLRRRRGNARIQH